QFARSPPPPIVTKPSQPAQPPICSLVHSGTSRQRINQGEDSNTHENMLCTLHAGAQSLNYNRTKCCIYTLQHMQH
ncbi:Hypothetical predicted protein, partial [Scomber scombrus]